MATEESWRAKMVDKTLSALLSESPVTEDITGDEPIETVIAGVSKAFKLRQLSATPINAQTGTSYVLVITDQGTVVTMDNVASSTLTIPNNSTVAFNIGATIIIRRIGDGGVTYTAAGGVTIEKKVSVGFDIAEKFAQIVLHKIAVNTWHVAGEIAPV